MNDPIPDPGEDEDFSDLENLLKKQQPSALKPDFTQELMKDQRRLASMRPDWRGMRPRMLASVLALTILGLGAVTIQRLSYQEDSIAGNSADSKPPITSAEKKSNFVPVSSERFLLRTSSGGVIESEEGPKQLMDFEYGDSYHWHDPRTRTHIRYFSPSRETRPVELPID
ncbi:MAG: hypothetical protein AAF226_09155 [Verrucomicrobiota bacterium]